MKAMPEMQLPLFIPLLLTLFLLIFFAMIPLSNRSAYAESIWTVDPEIVFGYSIGVSTIIPPVAVPTSANKTIVIVGLPKPIGMHFQSSIQYKVNKVFGIGMDFARYSSGLIKIVTEDDVTGAMHLRYLQTMTTFESYLYGYLPLRDKIDFYTALGVSYIVPELNVQLTDETFVGSVTNIGSSAEEATALVFKTGMDMEIATNTYITFYAKLFHDVDMKVTIAGVDANMDGSGIAAFGFGGMFKF